VISRFFLRFAEAWAYLGLPCHDRRIGPILAWELATIRHPNPMQAAKALAEVREAIEWARAMRARIDAKEVTHE